MRVFSCDDLSVVFRKNGTLIKAVEEVSVRFVPGKIIAVLGESGSGKSTLARFFAGALPRVARVSYLRAALPSSVALVEQDAASTLHPLIPVGTQLGDCIAGSGGKKKREEVFRLLREVELDPDLIFSRYPHRVSGGQAQRITVARALAVGAEMLVADEPTANVDLLSQRKLLEVLTGTVVKHDLPCLLVTHDLSIAEEVASSIAVISQGRIVEYGDPEDILYRPKSSYTRRLINSTLREQV